MIEDNPADIAQLFDPPPDAVIETHISKVFLCGDRAWKLKKAVRLPYVDFSTRELRRIACEREVALNRRTAPELYLGARRVCRSADGRLCIGGSGEPVDWLVEMRRFDASRTFDILVKDGGLSADHMEALAEAIARFHAVAEPAGEAGEEPVSLALKLNAEAFARLDQRALPQDQRAAFEAALSDEMARRRALLQARQQRGMVRRCHGDLHLRNIALIGNAPVLFDCLEFDDRLACIDTMYDVAFLLMDLLHHGRRDLANRCLNRYLEVSGDYEGAALLPLFIAVRAAIRCHIAGLKEDSWPEARRYLALALTVLAHSRPLLAVVAGFSGTGKTTVARRLAPQAHGACGAVILRSDVIRKRLQGIDPLQRLPADSYTQEASRRTYDAMLDRAALLLRGGSTVILDAVFGQAAERQAAEALARECGAGFLGLWLEAPLATLAARISSRRNDASDATAEVARWQHQSLTAPQDWHRVDASGGPDQVAGAAIRLLTAAAS